MGNIIIDIAMLVIAVIIIIKFTVTGFFRSVLDSCKLIISVVLALVLRVPVANLLGSLFFKNAIVGWVSTSLTSFCESNGQTASIFFTLYDGNESNFYNSILVKFGADIEQLSADFDSLAEGKTSVIPSLSENIGGAMSSMICSIIAVLGVFLISLIILSLIVPLLDKLTCFDGIKSVNRLLGFVIGVVIAALVLWGMSLGLYTLSSYVGPFTAGYLDKETIDKSLIVGFFNKLNVLGWISMLIQK
ncbi:MAG: CvpA family protein [Clostridia bacterium]|nr:CvpA family protein [Clostridia bacterium]